ncbi:MAG TPA: DUF433 domain-containing protein [Ktedonobacterales bacterium]|nr:DUF433 domain-containing protein [Ktedonobacterales bacterium]
MIDYPQAGIESGVIVMGNCYVDVRDDNLYVEPSRVTVEAVIHHWQSGQTPEQIQTDFPTVPLYAIYGTVAYYLEHRDQVDAFFRETEELDVARQTADEAARPEFYAEMRRRFAEARRTLGLESSAT